MHKTLAKNPYETFTSQTAHNHKKAIDYLRGKICHDDIVLDIGQRSPFTDLFELTFNLRMDNTTGNLDEDFNIPKTYYNIIIYSHTIEHQFCPSYTLKMIKNVMRKNSKLYIFLPCRPCFFTAKGHYHEIREQHMILLLDHVGLRIIETKKMRTKRPARHRLGIFLGVRPILRWIYDHIIVYETKKR